MKRNNNFSKSLISSLFFIFLCMIMVVGYTFAWFTDSAKSGRNKIVAGNLDVELEYSLDGSTWDTVTPETILFKDDTLWEPGHTELVYLKIRNAGSLALRYSLAAYVVNETPGINVDDEPFNLSDHLVFSKIVSDTSTIYADRTEARNAAGEAKGLKAHLEENDKLLSHAEKYVTLIVYMPEDVKNEANYKTGTEIPTIELGVTLSALQTAHESDNFNEEYDKTIKDVTIDSSTLLTNLKKGGTYTLGSDMVYNANTNANIDTTAARTIIRGKTSTLNLGGKTISFDSGVGTNNFAAIYLNAARTNLTVNGEGTINATATTGAYCFHLMGGRLSTPILTINGGTYTGNPTAVNVDYGKAYIKGGFFSCKPASNVTEDRYRYTLNCIDSHYKKGADIIVTGGTFVNFNPADNRAEGEHTDFVPEGYDVVSETKENGDIWYTVVPAESTEPTE